jgi:ParB family chromosome partitioning protein
MAEKRKLGRGLSTLIPTERTEKPAEPATTAPATPRAAPTEELPASALRDVAIDSIVPNPHQPRVHFDEDSLSDLAKSIKEIGVLQPLLVQETSPGKYQLIAGERRWRAAQRAKLAVVPVVVRKISELGSVEQALVENLHRQDLTALEEASAYQQLADDFDLTHDQIVQGYLADGRLAAGHARALLSCTDAKIMEQLAASAVAEGWSVRAVELAVKEGAPGKGKTDPGKGTGGTAGMKPAGLLELENLLAEFLDTKVGVSMNDKRGRITVDFADLIDLERIYRRMVEGIE